jgi:diaminopimelate epimerase
MPIGIPFTKASACGNDFLIVDGAHAGDHRSELTRRLCDRHDGIGADGVEWLYPAQDADIRTVLVNADGSDAEISGNGTRCVAAYQFRLTGKSTINVRTDAGIKSCRLIHHDGRSLEYEFESNLGEPQPGDPFSIKLAFSTVTGIPVNMGNPQFIVFVDDFVPGWQAEGAEISKHHDFKHGTNVEFVKVVDPHTIEIRIFERGAGETRSSGTGSSASAVAAISSGRAESPVTVIAPGGKQTVKWSGDIWITGPARIVASGEFFL